MSKNELQLILNEGEGYKAKEPQRFISWSVFTVALFKDEAGVDIIDRKEIEGSLFDIVDEVMKFITLYSKVAYRFTGKPRRDNVYEYPFEAIREAVINSVMHKYYFEHGHNNILRFLPNRIRIENYWQKPSRFVLGETVFRRNRIIADLFSKIHFGEKMGTGFERIQEICTKENTPFPQIQFNEDYFYVTFRQSHEYLELAAKAEIEQKEEIVLNERQQKSIEYVKSQGYISIAEYISLNKVSDKTARRDLAYLVTKGIFKREGVTTGLRFRLTSVSFGQLWSQEVPND